MTVEKLFIDTMLHHMPLNEQNYSLETNANFEDKSRNEICNSPNVAA